VELAAVVVVVTVEVLNVSKQSPGGVAAAKIAAEILKAGNIELLVMVENEVILLIDESGQSWPLLISSVICSHETVTLGQILTRGLLGSQGVKDLKGFASSEG
jgi:hypothetical protein